MMIRRIRLWWWDFNNGHVLALAERRQAVRIAEGNRSSLLDMVIDDLRRERAAAAGTTPPEAKP